MVIAADDVPATHLERLPQRNLQPRYFPMLENLDPAPGRHRERLLGALLGGGVCTRTRSR